MSRYPHTYSADRIRQWSHEYGCNISRAQAAQMRQRFAMVLGIPDEELSKKIADEYCDYFGIEKETVEGK